MRTIFKLTGFIGISLCVGILSCSDPENNELSPAVKEFLSMRMGSGNAMAQSMSGPINQSFQNLFNGANAGGKISGDSTASDSTDNPGDSTIIDTPWGSCGTITEIDNPDGSHTTMYDYGDGCELGSVDFHYSYHGKYAYTYKYSTEILGSVIKSIFYNSYNYDNYGGVYSYNGQDWSWQVSGGGASQGESSYDSANQKFSGNFSYADETNYLSNSQPFTYKGHGSTSYNDQKYMVESGEYEYSSGDDYYYKVEILKPLVYKYGCYQGGQGLGCFFWVYVSGRERVHYKNEFGEGTFEIDYGDGDCDAIVTVTEDGNTTVIDLATGDEVRRILW